MSEFNTTLNITKIDCIKKFNIECDELLNMIENLLEKYEFDPKVYDITKYKKTLSLSKKANVTVPLQEFSNFFLKYKKNIYLKDYDFFYNKNITNDNFLIVSTKFKKVWDIMSGEEHTMMWNKLILMTVFSENYVRLILNEHK